MKNKIVSKSALFQRIKRKLAHQGERIHKAKEGREMKEFGEFHITRNNLIIDGCFDLLERARDLKVAAEWEELG